MSQKIATIGIAKAVPCTTRGQGGHEQRNHTPQEMSQMSETIAKKAESKLAEKMAEELTRVASAGVRGSEDVEVEDVGGVCYAFGSEIAIMRIFAWHNANGLDLKEGMHIGYSKPVGKWFACIDDVG